MDLVYRTLFRDAEFVYCRDTDSLNYLKEKMFSFKQTGFRPDTTIFFGKDDAAWADSWLADRGLENGKFMTVVLRISSPKAKYHDPTGGAVSPQRCEHHMQALKYMIEEFVHRTGNKVLIAHETRDTLGENNARDFLFDILNGETRKNCVYLDFFWTPEQALGRLPPDHASCEHGNAFHHHGNRKRRACPSHPVCGVRTQTADGP